jgi:glycosyltransferase involved in cell wall biosynthesis
MRGKVSILTGGVDSHYAIPLILSLTQQQFDLEVLGSTEFLASPEFRAADVRFLNVHGTMDASNPLPRKVARVISAYVALIRYAAQTDSDIFHILWHNNFKLFDRVLLTAYYKSLGKTLVFTAHNVDIDERDGQSGLLNRASLRLMYRMVDHIFVHTEKMKIQLQSGYGVASDKITVHAYGMNTVAPDSGLTRADARRRLGIRHDEQVALFFGNVAPYKGLEYLIRAIGLLKREAGAPCPKLIIAGKVKNRRAQPYWESISRLITEEGLGDTVLAAVRHIRDEEIEVFMKAADVCVLPYIYIYQSGVLILAYRYGLPAIVSDAGSLKEDVIAGRTGYVCRSHDAADLARALKTYLASQLFVRREQAHQDIVEWARARYSWKNIAATLARVYETVRSGRETAACAADAHADR